MTEEEAILAIILLPDNPTPVVAKIPKVPIDQDGNPSANAVHNLLRRKHHILGLDYLHPVVMQRLVSLTNAQTAYTSNMHIFGWGDPELPLHVEVCNNAPDCNRGEGEAYWRVPILAICISDDAQAQLNAKVEDAALLMAYFQSAPSSLDLLQTAGVFSSLYSTDGN
ncbi:uncharacterized protein C8R40DRAFT_1069853 [Lentinula edodes]|uniref:uncharacterized protein n=1 Tax=Lentinula edodes TaxID=5353 RepID=UPI001E8E8C7D|nr:uncharacterized protein C8R40DRAFT_1069853 [Lentinula edodes]KAH7874951.1 hypothetical protein C8R40DRAFT_1069853 [Lentinula edodes]